MKTRLLTITILLFAVASMSAIYFIYQETEQDDGMVLHDAKEEIAIPQGIREKLEEHPVYLAMKERFPCATEESEIFNTGRIEIRVDATNPENGNKIILTLASSNRIERVDAYAQCLDKDNILLYQKHSHTLEYISNTSCLEYDLGNEYTHPPDAD